MIALFAYVGAMLIGLGGLALVLFDIGGARAGWEGDYWPLFWWVVLWVGVGFGGLVEEGFLFSGPSAGYPWRCYRFGHKFGSDHPRHDGVAYCKRCSHSYLLGEEKAHA